MNFGYKQLYIGSNLVDAASGARQAVICPATEASAGEIAWAGSADAEKALLAAQDGFKYWSALPLGERIDWMMKLQTALKERRDELRQAVMYEMGKAWGGTEEDVDTVIDSLSVYAEEIRRVRGEVLPDPAGAFHHELVHEPLGVVVACLAWNFPLLNVGFKLGPALAAGCSIIMKPSASSPLSAYLIGEICASIGFPAGVVNVLSGPSAEIGTTLVESPIPRLVTLIGSSAVGRKLMQQCATTVKRVSMELGGNAPVLVFDDADIAAAAEAVGMLKFGNTGQICVAPNRIFVHESVAGEFEKRLVEKAKTIKIGFGQDDTIDMGPMVSKKERDRVLALIQSAVEAGAELSCGGGIPAGMDTGSYIEPTVLRGVTPSMKLYREEIFGPVVSLITFTDDDEVIAMANDTDAGLASYVFTNSAMRIQTIPRKLQFGEVQINGFDYSLHLPHIGIKESGIGCDCSYLALQEYLLTKRVSTKQMQA